MQRLREEDRKGETGVQLHSLLFTYITNMLGISPHNLKWSHEN